METIKFFDFRQKSMGGCRTQSNVMSYNFKRNKNSSNYALRLPSKIGNMLMDKGYVYVRYAENTLTGDSFLVFSNQQQGAVKCSRSKSYNDTYTLQICCVEMLKYLKVKFSCGEHENFEISENLSNDESFITIKIIKKL